MRNIKVCIKGGFKSNHMYLHYIRNWCEGILMIKTYLDFKLILSQKDQHERIPVLNEPSLSN